MTGPAALRVLVVGDPYMPARYCAEALAELGAQVEVGTLQLAATEGAPPRTASARRLREYVGDPDSVAAAVDDREVLVVHGAPVTAEVMDAGRLRLVCCARGGPVNVDIAAATERRIAVTNAPGRNAQAVAELTIAFALLLIRHVPRATRYLLNGGSLARSNYEGAEFFGAEAPQLTLGLAGLGHVGREVATRAVQLGFTVIAYDPVPPAEVPAGVRMVPFQELLASSDIVSLHARATAGNRHMMGEAEFASMRPGACFINTARESLVDESALLEALRGGVISGAALDVVEPPPEGSRHRLLDLPNVIITPHIGGATTQTLVRGAGQAAAAVADLIAGRRPANLVNPEVLARRRVAS